MDFVCPQSTCNNRRFSTRSALLQHTNAPWHPYCSLCNRSFRNQGGLEAHNVDVHPPQFECELCDRIFDSQRGLASHTAAKHISFNCNLCDRTFNSEQGVDSHTITKHPRFECRFCDRWFTTERGRELHMAAKHTVLCTICDREFQAEFALNDHYYGSAAHPNCEVCGIGFRDYDELDEHTTAEHPGGGFSPVPCLACGGRLVNAAVLEDHYIESGNHPMCTLCYRGFQDDLKYLNHIKLAHPELYCNLCNRQFENTQAVASHYLNSPLHPNCFDCNLGFKDETEQIDHNNDLHATSTTSPAPTSTVLPLQPSSAPSTVLDTSVPQDRGLEERGYTVSFRAVGNGAVDMLQVDTDCVEESDGETDNMTVLGVSMQQVTLADDFPVHEEHHSLYDVFVRFATLLREQSKYRKLLHLESSEAQRLLNFLQLAVDHLATDLLLKGYVLNALLNLSKRYSLYPASFTLQDVKKKGSPRASGNFGDIWEGDLKGKTVCLKILKVYASSDIQKIFKAYSREAIVWSHVSHVNLLPFYGIHHLPDVDMTRICLVSPWMENGNVVEYLGQNPTENRLLIINDIIQGINYLHENQIIHGDLKGVNILVTSTRRACLADFGLSTVNDPDIIKWTGITTTQATGTIRWQAPELFASEVDYVELNKASDIYAFSCVCYEVLTGQYPFFEIPRDFTVIFKVMNGGRPSHPSTWQIELPLDLDMTTLESMWPLIQQCWSYEPLDRPDAQSIILQLPMDGVIDTRPNGDWGDFTPSRFRNAVNQTGYDISIDDARELLSFLS